MKEFRDMKKQELLDLMKENQVLGIRRSELPAMKFNLNVLAREGKIKMVRQDEKEIVYEYIEQPTRLKLVAAALFPFWLLLMTIMLFSYGLAVTALLAVSNTLVILMTVAIMGSKDAAK